MAESGEDDVESFRSRNRQESRRSRRDDDDNEDKTAKAAQNYALERQLRMARLREELKQEDEVIAALDQKEIGDDVAEDAVKPQETIIEVHEEELHGLDEEEQMRKLLGIESFGSTKGQKVEDNHKSSARGAAAKNKSRKYRQYMNRKNGFNRPLEKMK
ncbi:DUF1777 domain containing protein [Nitzschia inconspicua]|uniref:DUF1777 domain containing protein n=1 Tax=Nitzschia inconspicua TaxID=303405 RepID=A0A9K3KFI9_9STRA|nr:DUF1777 domain containing protein [Nitzschia inconspicua]